MEFINIITNFADVYANLVDGFAAMTPWLVGPTYLLIGAVNPRAIWLVWVVLLPLLAILGSFVWRIGNGKACVAEGTITLMMVAHFVLAIALCGVNLI